MRVESIFSCYSARNFSKFYQNVELFLYKQSKSGGINNKKWTYVVHCSFHLFFSLWFLLIVSLSLSLIFHSCPLCVCSPSDIRVNYCYTKFENGRCLAPKPQNTSKQACCCTGMPGQGWGDPCEICPSKGEGAYTSYHVDTRTLVHKIVNMCCSMVFMTFHLSRFQMRILFSVPMRDINRGQMTTQKVFCVINTLSLSCISVIALACNSLGVDVFLITDIDECLNDPCINGQCINTDGSFRCECPMGYRLDISGVTCEG